MFEAKSSSISSLVLVLCCLLRCSPFFPPLLLQDSSVMGNPVIGVVDSSGCNQCWPGFGVLIQGGPKKIGICEFYNDYKIT